MTRLGEGSAWKAPGHRSVGSKLRAGMGWGRPKPEEQQEFRERRVGRVRAKDGGRAIGKGPEDPEPSRRWEGLEQ